MDNSAGSSITFQYHHRDYDYWSAEFPIKAGFAMRLPRGHWIQDIVGIKIVDGQTRYVLSELAVRRLAQACLSTKFARNFGYAGDCYLTYRGNGKVVATAQKPANLNLVSSVPGN